METVDIKIWTKSSYRYELPTYATLHSSGFDFLADTVTNLRLNPGQRTIIPTGLWMAIPPGYELQIRSKSGLAFLKGIVVTNSPGTCDADYRGEICVILTNIGSKDYDIEPGQKIAQGVICPVYQAAFKRVENIEDLGTTDRGEGGFGSTGK